jgi:phosphotransferase system enzyme I (PtsI)
MNGIGVSPGISIGKAGVIKKVQIALTGILLKDEISVAAEIERFDQAVNKAVSEIEFIKQNKSLNLLDVDIQILETEIEFLGDPQIREDVVEKISSDKKNLNDALIEVFENLVSAFENLDDEYMRARSADIRDIGNRILKQVNLSNHTYTQQFNAETIIIAEDISPSDTITMGKHVIGFATQAGSKTSHAAIIAKAKGVPAVVGCGNDLAAINNNDIIVLDGSNGLVFINPDQQLIADYTQKRKAYIESANRLKQLKDVKPITTDRVKITLMANISGPDDMDDVFENGGEGVGLLRTELLFMNRDSFPSEDEQFEFYKKVALRSKNKTVIVRTIDIGGDKQLPYFNLPAEQNPFLGYRAIRICLDRTDLFITQLKAILRAAVFGDLKIMLPMISNVQEVREAKKILAQAKCELSKENTAFNRDVELGIMIEIPSAAITADILAKEVDFFSIGTNDLCQYTLAVDRMNEKITHLYDPFSPGVLRLINNVIDEAHKHKIHVGMCGEMAADPLATLLLLGMGLTDFSMGAAAIPAIKNIIINNRLFTAKQICEEVMTMDNSQSIVKYLQEFTAS